MGDTRSKKEATLAALYARMSSAELEARLGAGGLVPQAQAAAKAELLRRQAATAVEAAAGTAEANSSGRNGLLWAAAITAVVLGLLWFVMPSGYYFLLLAICIPTVLAPLGKLFPMWGKILAGLLVVAPGVLGLWLWHRGELAWKGGDYGPLGTLISWAVLTAVVAMCWAVAGSLLIGAGHRGSWSELSAELSRKQEEKFEEMHKRL
jgi:hypothetical protein